MMHGLRSAVFPLAFVVLASTVGSISQGTNCTCEELWGFSKLHCTLERSVDFVDVESCYCKYAINDLRLQLVQNIYVSASILPKIKLSRLKIEGKHVQGVSETAFVEYKESLDSLEISQSALKDIPTSALKGFRRLRSLLLHENSIGSVNCSFKEVPLQYVILRDNEISSLDTCSFPRNLSILSLTNNYIEDLNGSLRELGEMGTVFVNRNRITTLEGQLDGMSKLWILDASWNKIERVGTDQVNLPALSFMNVSHNRISELGKSLNGFSNLHTLDLSYNDIRFLKVESFTGLPHLQFLSLSGNSIRHLEDSQFHHLTRLHTLIISNNMITSLDSKITALHSLKRLDAAWNNIRNVGNAFSELTDLEQIDLSNNRVSDMSNMLHSLSRLKVLNLAWNELSNIREDNFRGADSLETLNLSANPLSTLKGTVFASLANLKSLDITLSGILRLDGLLVPGFMNISLPKEGSKITDCSCKREKTLLIGDATCQLMSMPDSRALLLQENGIEVIGC